MHRALAVPDVLLHIISQVESKDTLAALAQTSSIVSGCALDKLWHTIDSMVILARCMPSGVWDEVETYTPFEERATVILPDDPRDSYYSQLSLSSARQDGDWLGPRFRAYAKRIRHLSTGNRVVNREKWPVPTSYVPPLIGQTTNPHAFPFIPAKAPTYNIISVVHPNVLRAWRTYSYEVSPLFPHLLHVQWITGLEDLPSFLWGCQDRLETQELTALLLVPSLSSLKFGVPVRHGSKSQTLGGNGNPGRGVTALFVLQEAMMRCPSLDTIDIYNPKNHRILMESQSVPAVDAAFSSHLQHLRRFCCGVQLPNSTVRHIASLPHLEAFAALLRADLNLTGLSRLFPAARELRFLCTSLAQLRALVAAVQSTRVHTLELTSNDDLGPRPVRELLTLVAAHPSAGALRHFRIGPDVRSERHPPPVEFTPDDVRPLLHLTGLRSVSLRQCAVDPAGDVVAQMLDAWPALEKLNLGHGAQLELVQLLAAAHTHSTLRELKCTVVIRAGAPLPAAHGLVHTRLRRIYCEFSGRIAPADLAAVAHMFATVFPSLKSVNLGFTGGDLQALMRAGEQARLAGRPWTLRDYEADAISHPNRSHPRSPSQSPDT